MTSLIDRLSGVLGAVAAWLFVATGAMLTWEVLARYLFNAPTVWAAELSQLLLIWGVFLGAAVLLRDGRHIAITMLTGRLGRRGRLLSEALALTVVMLFAAWVAWHGAIIAVDNFVRGRSSGTMMNLPNWIAEIALPLGFGLLAAQALVNLLRLSASGRPPGSGEQDGH